MLRLNKTSVLQSYIINKKMQPPHKLHDVLEVLIGSAYDPNEKQFPIKNELGTGTPVHEALVKKLTNSVLQLNWNELYTLDVKKFPTKPGEVEFQQ